MEVDRLAKLADMIRELTYGEMQELAISLRDMSDPHENMGDVNTWAGLLHAWATNYGED